MSVGNFMNRLGQGFKKNLPGILTGTGIGLMFTGTVLAVKATPAAMEDIEEKKREEGHEKLTVVQTVEAAGKRYIPAAVAELLGTGCLIAAQKENHKRIGTLLTAYNMAENGLREAREYRRIVAERIGEKKEAEIYHEVVQQQVDNHPQPAAMADEVIEGDAPKPRCYDKNFERYYYVDYDTVDRAVNKLNHEINNGLNGYVSLNDFYEEIGVNRMQYGDNLGWNTETGLIEIPEKGSLQYAGTPSGWPCWVLEFLNPPQYEYKFFRKH